MKKEELKTNLKGFWMRNKNAIMAGVMVGTGSLIGYSVASRELKKLDGKVVVNSEKIGRVLMDAQKRYGDTNGADVFTGIADEIMKVEDLGKLGDFVSGIAEGNGMDPTKLNFTHFIAIGPSIEKA